MGWLEDVKRAADGLPGPEPEPESEPDEVDPVDIALAECLPEWGPGEPFRGPPTVLVRLPGCPPVAMPEDRWEAMRAWIEQWNACTSAAWEKHCARKGLFRS